MSLSTTRNQYIDFNEEPYIEFGDGWPTFSSKMCFCELDEKFNIHPCSLHKNELSFEEKQTPSLNNIVDEDFNLICSDKLKMISTKLNAIENATNQKFYTYNENFEELSSNLLNKIDENITCSHKKIDESSKKNVHFNSSNKSKSKSQSKQINETRKFKLHKYPNSETSLDVRYDVMNKNFIRGIKRECKRMYSEFLRKNNITKINYSLVKK